MNTDNSKRFGHVTRELWFALAHMRKWAKVNSRPVCLKPFLYVLFLSVFISVHPWFQSPAFAAP
ncbi:MAG TPA: hypothetical protein VGJ06_01530, partial [Candidatus Acidoferrum sp.]